MSDELIPLGQLQPLSGNRNTVIVSDGKRKNDLIPQVMNVKGLSNRPGGTVLKVKPRSVEIEGVMLQADPHDLIAIIKALTQEIGDWKKMDNLMGKYKVVALRAARTAAVSDLKKFGIHWEIDKNTGESNFWL